MAISVRPDNRAGPLGAAPRRPTPPPRRPPGVPRPQQSTQWPPPGLESLTRLPSTPTQAANRIAGYTDPLEAQAMSLVDPLISSITNRIGAETRAGAGAIGGYAGKLAESLVPYQASAGNIYGQAEQSQAAVDAALSSALRGGGDTLAKELGGKLAEIGAPASSLAAAAVPAATGAGSANALLGTGSASLSKLIGEGAHAEEYASKQPGIARSQGLSDIRDLELAQQAKLYDQAQQVAGQVPGIVENLRQEQERTREFNVGRGDRAAQLAEQRRQFDVSTRGKMLLAQMATETDQAKLKQEWKQFMQLQSNENARTGAQIQSRESIAAENRQAQSERAAASNQIRWYQADTARWKAQHPTATTQQTSAASRARWVKMAEDFYHGTPGKQHYDAASNSWIVAPGTSAGPVRYGPALRILMSAGATRQEAMQILNALYQPGEGGRPAKVAKPTPDRGFRDAKLK
jgi:hypothetical protein